MKQSTPLSKHNPAALLRTHGLRVTPQRLAVAEWVFSKPMHVTARIVHEQIKLAHPAVSMNTVYLTLGQFEACGLLNRFEVHGNIVFDSNTSPHDHACCNRCGTIIDLESSQPESPKHTAPHPTQLKQWQIEGERRIWVGLCPACSSESVS